MYEMSDDEIMDMFNNARANGITVYQNAPAWTSCVPNNGGPTVGPVTNANAMVAVPLRVAVVPVMACFASCCPNNEFPLPGVFSFVLFVFITWLKPPLHGWTNVPHDMVVPPPTLDKTPTRWTTPTNCVRFGTYMIYPMYFHNPCVNGG